MKKEYRICSKCKGSGKIEVKNRAKYTDKEIKKMVKLREKGLSYAKIGKKVGMHPYSVQFQLNRLTKC